MINELDGSILKAINLLHKNKGKIIITGLGKSGHIGKKLVQPCLQLDLLLFILIVLNLVMVI